MSLIAFASLLAFLTIRSTSACEAVTGKNDGGRVKRSSGDDDTWPACLIVQKSVFIQVYPGLFAAWSFGGGICLELAGSTGNRIEDCLFDGCHVSKPFADDFGGGFAVLAASVTIERCCGQDCYAELGQFFYVDVSSTFDVCEISAVRCAASDGGDVRTGALDFYDNSVPMMRNVNVTDCYAFDDGSAIDFWGDPGSPTCRFFTILKCSGASSIYSRRLLFSLSFGNFVSNSHSSELIECRNHFIQLDHCHFKLNSGRFLCSEYSGSFIVVNCHLSSPLPDGVSYSQTMNNVISEDAVTLPLCHLSTVYCHREIPCETFTFTLSALFDRSSQFPSSAPLVTPQPKSHPPFHQPRPRY
jgi:hypothetical protein